MKNLNFKKISGILLIIIATVFSSCIQNNTVFEEYHKFDDLSWNRFDIVKYDVDLEGDGNEYDVYLNIRHIPEIPYREMKMNLSVFSPSGDMRTNDFTLNLYDNEKNRLSDCMGDLCDITKCIRRNLRISDSGTVSFEIENKFTKVEMPGIMEVGLILKKSDPE